MHGILRCALVRISDADQTHDCGPSLYTSELQRNQGWNTSVNGGATQTVGLLPGSPAIDTGDNAVCAAAP